MELYLDRPISTMTAAELAAARGLPVHCQTVRRAKQGGGYSFSDIEELTREQLDRTVAELSRQGWRRDGGYFIRTTK